MILRQFSKKISLVAALFLAGVTVWAQGGRAPSPADQSFIVDTLESNQAQIHMSQLAQQKSSSDDVKDLGYHMVEMHNQFNDQLKPFIKVLEVSEPKKPSKQEKQEMAKLQALSGPDFDTEYLQAMAKEQQRTLKEFTEQSKSQNPDLQKLSATDLPVLNQNFEILQKVAQAHNATLESKK